jgi:hypothetical protein
MKTDYDANDVAVWIDGANEVVVRADFIELLNWSGSWVDKGRAIPDSWSPIIFTNEINNIGFCFDILDAIDKENET